MRQAAASALVVLGAVVSTSVLEPVGVAQTRERPDPDTYHWVLPVGHRGVEVAPLHPHDCYVIQQADGIAYFGEPPASAAELQRQLTMPVAHLVETREDHPECTLDACLQVAEVARAIQDELTAGGTPRLIRRADHRPTPFDDWFGGAYADVGSGDRHTFSAGPEQLMLADHLAASQRGHCYEARLPRVLSVHVRDQQQHEYRTGVYSGFLYIEHHHPSIAGTVVARNHDRTSVSK